MPESPEARTAPGILYYDPNPTTAKLATASLRLAGYEVYNAANQREAVALFKAHGADGDKSIVALLLDASADPTVSAAVLRELVRMPGASQLPGILIVSRRNPNPIPAATGLPTVRRPFSSPALLKVVSQTIASIDAGKLPTDMDEIPDQRKVQLARLLSKHFPSLGELAEADVASLFAEIEGAEELPSPPGEQAIHVDLAAQRLESLLEMLSDDSVTGMLSISSEGREARLHLSGGHMRLAEYFGDDEDLKLGRFVVEGGFMRDDELEAFLSNRDPAGRPLGQRLVEAGFITGGELGQAILAQAREITCHLLTFRKGAAGFVPLAKLETFAGASDEAKVELAVSEALLDGLRRLDENALMGPHLPVLDDVYVRDDAKVSRMARELLAREELDVLELINGRNSVKDIARRTRTGTFAVSRIVYRLSKSSVVRRRVTPVTV
jgi:CheY-like chemotaxis protein